MELEHFSHPHRLILTEDQNGSDETELKCSGCNQPILGPSYICSDNEYACTFQLHKTCAEMPQKLTHSVHPEHPLTLTYLPDITYQCDSCFKNSGDLFYNCSLCDFYLDIPCATLPEQIEHIGHTHPLTLQLKPSLFRCDACGNTHDIQGLSYQCHACHYWVHHECISLPESIERVSHDHLLSLANVSRLEFSKFNIYCDFCFELVKQRNSAYCCAACRYVVHVGCANAVTDEKEEVSDAKDEADESNLVCLPMADESVDLINHLLNQFSVRETDSTKKITKAIDHEHPLSLFEEYSGSISNEVKSDEMCNACLERISAPYHGCSECDFLLHKCCANLPGKVQHPSHPEHALALLTSCCIGCNACENLCNGFAYYCGECLFYLDIKCASFPQTLKHEAHEHALTIQKEPGRARCKACQQTFSGYALECARCKFNLHIECASLPRTVTYRDETYDIILAPPSDDPSQVFFCDICKEETNPKIWFYLSEDGNSCLHAGCINNIVNGLPNVKFGAINDENHEHPLTFVRKSKIDPPSCESCGDPCDGISFQCKECDYNLDFKCASRLM